MSLKATPSIGGVSGITLSLPLLAAYYKLLQGFPIIAVISLASLCWSLPTVAELFIFSAICEEIFPIRTRGRGISLAVLTNFGSNALVTFAFSPLKSYRGQNLFLLFTGIVNISLFIVFVVPKTKGLSLKK
ncbi:hypothetical protein IFM89_027094 [Coptis chinensis]|uniref:Major facilitator superfamily (MFS) profile domain-containing protein n=1 Tax=Coptis chinensis TaxID=261450 RepID=A0A835LSX4_9MAGN|nr:hypothetical protein IFM89_027094 [Coptis chinensis]